EEDQREGCVSSYPTRFPDCGPPASQDDVFFAVKTCEKFHTERVPVVQRTWGKHAKHIEIYSEKEDTSIPTVYLGVNNTERGHCAKTFAILRRALEQPLISKMQWLVIADDDTLLSVRRMLQLLACYDPRQAVALGERYAYGATAGFGYDYLTGGSSMVFSITAVRQMLDSGRCMCPTPDTPDDMTIGMCLKSLGIPVTHSPYFHQARPEDYSEDMLSHQLPVSFHKHWMVDPYRVYDDWFADADVAHDEL
ncbi:PREDICTED: beta-1,3-glucosyltransferase-like, partial [Priapulus caudatus]|uniref:Beta-1,3-glucosyltransferase-like n=1 Tax=Priapulus caudatus TaxID=37621 RepID=A0ABM1EYZ2_PRICU